MRHAYLIIAHNEFEVLQKLIDALDDPRNDIYVHIDAKVKNMPILTSRKSRLTVLSNRIRVIWSDVSQIQSEYLLFEAAFSEQEYYYYHLISGTHYPLKSQNEIHAFFDSCHGASVLTPIATSREEIRMKLGRFHLFLSHLISRNGVVNQIYHLLWRTLLYCERILGIERATTDVVEKVSNWCSLSREAVWALLQEKDIVLQRYNHTFCGDEFFVPTVLRRKGIMVLKSKQLLFCKFTPYTPKTLAEEDLRDLEESDCLFGRKFTRKSLKLIEYLRAKKVLKEDKR